jgi:glycosyltransferase involved in cell wall biosynthesis
MTTEGTYPFVVGGVSSWCDLLVQSIPEVRWQILPLAAANRGRRPLFDLPSWACMLELIELWSNTLPPGERGPGRRARKRSDLAARLVRGSVGWDGDVDELVEAFVWCREHPCAVRPTFRSRGTWEGFLVGLNEVVAEGPAAAGAPERIDTYEAARLYQTVYWLARTAAVPTPETDLLLATAAGWAAVPALVHRALHGTPMILVEHGIYVREAYLANVGVDRYGGRFFATRLARGLARAAYARADVVAPVSDSHSRWERAFAVDPSRIRVIYNGVGVPDRVEPPPGTSTVVSVGRVDPLKDVRTMLRVAAEVIRRVPEARFLHYGPVPENRLAYGSGCRKLHAQLGLGDRFRFMGATSDPHGAVQGADVVLMTSISEGFPISILEAMAQGRPVVATDVGGVADAVKGCGILAPSGDVYSLAMAVCTLLRNPALAGRLGLRGHRRVARVFTKEACIARYRRLFEEVATGRRAGEAA